MRARTVVLVLLAAALLCGTAGAGEEGQGSPRIRIEPESFDFGKALPGKTLRKEFTIRNFGDRDLVIEGVTTTCGCTAALPKEKKIAPGGSTPLAVTLETRSYTGRVERRVLVRSNDPETPRLEIRVSVTVEPPAK